MLTILEKLQEEEIIALIEKHFGLTEKISLALQQARKSHQDMFREDGESYVTEHVYPVTALALIYYGDGITEEIIASCLLHDVLEDDETMTDEIFQEMFGETIYIIVKALSKPNPPELEGLTETEKRKILNKAYFENLVSAPAEAQTIKLLDRIDNLYRAMTFGEEIVRIYIQETTDFFLPFARKIDENLYQQIVYLLEDLKVKGKEKRNI